MVCHKDASVTHRFFSKRKKSMTKTIEAITAKWLLAKPPFARAEGRRLTAQWQSGVQTMSGYAQRKLRFSFAQFPGGSAAVPGITTFQ